MDLQMLVIVTSGFIGVVVYMHILVTNLLRIVDRLDAISVRLESNGEA
jgi:hypothetical protein